MILNPNDLPNIIIYRGTADREISCLCSKCKRFIYKGEYKVRVQINERLDELVLHEECYQIMINEKNINTSPQKKFEKKRLK